MAIALLFLYGAVGASEESDFREDFLEALKAGDMDGMYSIVDKNRVKIPREILAILEEALEAKGEEKESLLYIVEALANVYNDVSGDIEFFKEVKKKMFDARLSRPVRSILQGGVHVVETPEATGEVKNIFKPDNIIIRRGETVRWVNKDKIAHLLGSMPFIGEAGLFSPYIEPGKGWEHTFNEPGEYYYICFIHRSMIGKITVVELEEKAAVER